MKPTARLHLALAVLVSGFVCGCGNPAGSLPLNQSQTGELVKRLGTYEGPAQARRIMGAMVTGIWTVGFVQQESGALTCKCTLRLHDSENGWGSPETATVDVRCYRASAKDEYSLKAEGQFGEGAPWSIFIDKLSLAGGPAVDTISLFDMDSYEITLRRK